jgi:hypothetical protein
LKEFVLLRNRIGDCKIFRQVPALARLNWNGIY